MHLVYHNNTAWNPNLLIYFCQQKNGDQEQGLHEYLELESKLAVSELENPIEMLRIRSRRWHQLINELDLAKRELDVLEKAV